MPLKANHHYGTSCVMWGEILIVLNMDVGGVLIFKFVFQDMSIYDGRCMCNLFSLNYHGCIVTKLQRSYQKKGVQFEHGEQAHIFQCDVDIY